MSITRPCVRVSVRDGERVRKHLLNAGLLDIDYKIQADGDSLIIPLTRECSKREMQTLLGIEVGVETHEFDLIRTGPRTLAEALEGVLSPEEIALLPRAYDLVGDIAILEIPRELEAHKYEIGRAFHKIHPNFVTVLAKHGAITGTKRTRQYELLSGLPKTDTIHIEYGCRIAVDLAKAYFSPRLLEEHHRLAKSVKDGNVVLDMFTGVGPFALHIAKTKKAHIVAVDINPDAIALLKKSMTLNRLVGTIEPVVSDAREYVRTQTPQSFDHVIMNHPSGSSEFMPEACLAVRSGGVIHYYDFVAGPSPEEVLQGKVTDLVTRTGRSIQRIGTIRRVRDSAPYEYQMVIDIIID